MKESEFSTLDENGDLEPLSDLIVEKLLERLYPGSFPKDMVVPDHSAAMPKGMLNLAQAALRLHHSYFWLSRNYRKVGLKPSKVGRRLVFSPNQIDALLARKQVRHLRGRPAKRRLLPTSSKPGTISGVSR